MNGFSRKPAHAVPNWQAPTSTGKPAGQIEEPQVEGGFASAVAALRSYSLATRARRVPVPVGARGCAVAL